MIGLCALVLGKYHTVVHLHQRFLQLLSVVTFLLHLGELVNCLKALVADVDEGIDEVIIVGL